jgi:ketosteroid isomerase-like protein
VEGDPRDTDPSMSRENVELVRRMYDAYLSGDAERALGYFHPEVELDFSVRVDTSTGRGREDLARIVGSWGAAWDGYTEEIDEILDLGDEVCVVATQHGRGRDSGVELENRFAGLYEVRDGQITRLRMYMDIDDALKAARASEST